MGFQICIPIFAYRNAYKHQELGGNLRCHRALFYVLFRGCGSNYFCCHGMSVENCNSTTCLISSDVHLCGVGQRYGY